MSTLQSAWLLVGGLRLGSDARELIASDGALDRALYRTIESNEAPEWLASTLHFAKTRVGLRCVELEDILAEAQGLGLTEAPNPRYKKLALKADSATAQELVSDFLHMDPAVVKEFGKTLWKYLNEENDHSIASA